MSHQDLGIGISKTLYVDRVFRTKDHQWHYVKTADSAKRDRFKKYTLLVQRTIKFDGTPGQTIVEVRSTCLVDFLHTTLKDSRCPGLHKVPPSFTPDILFHLGPKFKDRLSEEKAKNTPEAQSLNDLNEMIAFLDGFYGPKMDEVESFHSNGEITYQDLWTLFAPGCEVIRQASFLDEIQALKFISGSYEQTITEDFYEIDASMISHDGIDLGWGDLTIKIPSFKGSRTITKLPIVPLRFHPDSGKIRQVLIKRGSVFLSLTGPTCMEYTGFGVTMRLEAGKWVEKKFYTTGRVMVDAGSYSAKHPDSELLSPNVISHIDAKAISPEILLFCSHRVLGFSLTTKEWGAFEVSKLQQVAWAEDAFDKLIINEKRRDLVKYLIRGHKISDIGFDDIIPGKGKGLIGLLSGPPGTGKTLTAETVAELARRPLYAVTAGELGTEAEKVDICLEDIMSIVRRWGCVLLIDEADVFLQKRREGQIQQNAIVSVFLRKLEYLQGIVVLTSNHHQEIDEAFNSRIHFRFHYPQLTENDRLMVWRTFLPTFSPKDLQALAKIKINGREIKNVIACATWISEAKGKLLHMDTLSDTLENITGDFPGN